MEMSIASKRIQDCIRSLYYPLFYSSTLFLDQKAGETLSTFITLEELLSAPVSATGVFLLHSGENDGTAFPSPLQCSKAVVMICEERPGTIQMIERIKNTLQTVESLVLLTNWTKEDAISYEQVLLEENSASDLGILPNLDQEPFERTANELKVYYRTSQVDISYAPFLGMACPLDNLFITASSETDQGKLLMDNESSQVEGISQLSEPLRSILASVARNIASFYCCSHLRPMKTFCSGPLSKLVVEQFQRCATRANEEMKEWIENLEETDSYLLVVDRSLILSSSFYTKESLLERMFSYYPHRCWDLVSPFSRSYATQLWKLGEQLASKKDRSENRQEEEEDWERIYQFCKYGESGQGLIEECRLDREDSHLAKSLLMSLISVDIAEQSISIIRELLINILQESTKKEPGRCFDDYSLEQLLQHMKQEKGEEDKPLSEVYPLVFEIATIAHSQLESSSLAKVWNPLSQVMKDILQSERKTNATWYDSSSNLLLSVLDGIQNLIKSSSIPSLEVFYSIILLITWVYVTPTFRKFESNEEDVLIDTLVHFIDEEEEEWLQRLLFWKEREEEWKPFSLWSSNNISPSSVVNGSDGSDVIEASFARDWTKRLLSNLSLQRDIIDTFWHEEGETMSLLFRRMISQFPEFRMPSLVHVVGKLKEIREEESFGLKLEYIPPPYLGERLLSGLQRLRAKPFGSSGMTKKTLVVFVLGGIVFSEIASAENFVKEFFPDEFDQVIFGSTHLTSAMDLLWYWTSCGEDKQRKMLWPRGEGKR